ncbi:HugZ family protein [Corallincola spongiicola]|uniref:Heme utilization protein HutZ n=1 Tax=Corallincola spongiicola TaxID=2520508 RepID=A0ABY1WLF4_9GAMM|nr:pyridoxamine 5'-phosphate oxidase family protein [Corallincola spongiicola]TAA41739.1 heme utilization protein HutZ [Corallincola spongiicola]
MSSERIAGRISPEIMAMLNDRKSLFLSSLTSEGEPYASHAPYAVGDECLYVLLSEIAVHAINLQANPQASVLIIEDEDSAKELFARQRVSYSMTAELLPFESDDWLSSRDILAARHGERIEQLSQLRDFKLFRLTPKSGRFVKGFGKAFAFTGKSLTGEAIAHLRDGHKKRDDVAAPAPTPEHAA